MSARLLPQAADPAHARTLSVLALVTIGTIAAAGCADASTDDLERAEPVRATRAALDPSQAVDLVLGALSVPAPLDANGAVRPLRIELAQGTRVVLSASGSDASDAAWIRLFDGSLSIVAEGPGVVRATAAQTGVHYVEIGPTPHPVTVAAAAFTPLASTADEATTWEFPPTGSETWRAVHARAANDVWAVGAGAVLHWNGATFERARLAEDASLRAIWAASPTDVWAAGERLYHFDGATWSIVVEPAATRRTLKLTGTSPTDVWRLSTSGGTTTLTRWDGARWTDAAPGQTVPETLAVGSANDAWLFGIVEASPRHWNGASWLSVTAAETVYSPQQPARDAIAFADGSVGAIFADPRSGGVRVRNPSGQWRAISSFTGRYPLGLRYQGSDLRSLWGATPNLIWVTEEGGKDVFRLVQNDTERWQAGSEWRNVRSDVRDAVVTGTADGTAWFAGAQGQLGRRVATPNGPDDERVAAITESGPRCQALGRAPTGEVWAACEASVRRRALDGSWSTIALAPEVGESVALYAESATHAFVATSKGALLELNGTASTTLGTFPAARFTSVSGDAGTNVWFASPSAIVRWNGANLAVNDLGRADLGVAEVVPNGAFVAAGTSILSFDGTIWTTSAPLGERVTHLSAISRANAWAAGDHVLVRWNGASWGPEAWTANLPAACANDAIAAISTTATGVVVTTGRGCVGTLTGNAWTWVKRPVRVGPIVVLDPSSVLGAASTGGVVHLSK